MRKVFDGSAMLAPLPAVLVSVSDGQKDNLLTVAWTGILSSKPARLYVSIRPDRFSHDIIVNSKQFVVNLVTKDLCAATDFCGIRSGRDVDKFAEMGLTKEKASKVNVPLVGQSPVCLECVVFDTIESGSHTIFLADIVAVDIDEKIMSNGAVDYEKAQLVSYQHGDYYATGKHLGRFGFAAQRKFIRLNGKGVSVDIDSAKLTKRKK